MEVKILGFDHNKDNVAIWAQGLYEDPDAAQYFYGVGVHWYGGLNAENLNFTLLSDTKGEVAEAFGVPTRTGGKIQRTVGGKAVTLVRENTASRWTFVIDKKGKIIYKNSKVNPTKDLSEVAKAIQTHK